MNTTPPGKYKSMTDALVVATPATATGFRLGGARTITAGNADQTVAAVTQEIADGQAAVIAVHGALWSLVAPSVRATWTKQTSPLILTLPDEDGDVSAAKDAALRDLLARAIGYQITFTPSGGSE
ncbi:MULTISPECIES: V-type ATP synthase subunit F [Kribbella]|uniref:Vacuolar-type H+-ATPase subunit F/Vma7 n=1 Tax=Kribbella pratensis TaxID=2512112 RepID=A0ABY2F7S7_9ACTN|nr:MULTISPECIES: V-type ATP synthase subunit F [Kribbella]TDW79520.1 vacuolar-type H+-ATPase subunit F/Vma7 [Kribbella sp. VKM Ac-2566]TDW84324.1 vacuolar-type H+-ATPase subunit F/Vma7 [Kribbella pratensis]